MGGGELVSISHLPRLKACLLGCKHLVSDRPCHVLKLQPEVKTWPLTGLEATELGVTEWLMSRDPETGKPKHTSSDAHEVPGTDTAVLVMT